MNPKVSIVIIGRNEEKRIGKCLSAVLTAAEQIGGAEIIFVDSASTDNTVSIVQSYGVRVVSLKPELKLSPSLGRFIGSQHATGEFILFVDADTLVYENFLAVALEHFQNNENVGGINGYLEDLNESGEQLTDIEERFDEIRDVKWLRGPCCFYRRQTLQEVGSFNPDLAVEEEAELGLRLVKKGWKLNIIPLPMACHTRCYHGQTFNSIINAFKRDIVVGRLGEIMKTTSYAFQAGNGLIFCWLRLKTTIIFTLWLFLLIISFVLPAFLYPKTVFFSTILLGGLFVFRKKRSLKQTLLFFPAKLLCFIDVLSGFHKIKFNRSHSYSLDIIG